MDTNDSPRTATRRWGLAGGKIKMVIGSVAVLAIPLLAALVFTRYEASMPLENMPTEYMHVTISAQDLAPKTDAMPGPMPSMQSAVVPSLHDAARSSTARV